jgi:hypothetical protein
MFRATTDWAEPPANGGSPASISYSTQPRLDVAMNHAVRVGIGERVGDLGGQRGRVLHRQLLLPAETRAQRLALHVRHDEVGRLAARPVVHGPRVEDREDVRMLQPGGHLDLAEEPRDPVGPAELGTNDLDGDRPPVAQVAREVDGGHATGTDLALEGVAVTER